MTECTIEEKGWFLDAMFQYNLNGQISEHSDRFMNSHLRIMVNWFDANAERWAKSKLLNSINQRMRWAKDSPEETKKLEDEKRFLQTHSVRAYMSVYARIPSNTDEYERIHYVSDSVSVSVSEDVSVPDSDSVSVPDSDSVDDFPEGFF